MIKINDKVLSIILMVSLLMPLVLYIICCTFRPDYYWLRYLFGGLFLNLALWGAVSILRAIMD